jgi:hypothetical protein
VASSGEEGRSGFGRLREGTVDLWPAEEGNRERVSSFSKGEGRPALTGKEEGAGSAVACWLRVFAFFQRKGAAPGKTKMAQGRRWPTGVMWGKRKQKGKGWGDLLPGGFLQFVFVKEKGRVFFLGSPLAGKMEPSFCWFWTQQNSKLPKGWGGGFSVNKFRLGFLFPPNFLRPPCL